MKISKSEKISARQLAFIIIQISVGTGILSLPRMVAKTTNQDGWLTVILGGIIWAGAIFILYQLASRFPQQTIIEYSEQIMGKWLGKVISLSYILYTLTAAAIIARLFVALITSFLLPKTPILVNLGLLLLPCYYLSTKRVKILARLNEFLFFILSPAFLVLLPVSFRINWLNFQPVFQSGLKKIMNGTLITTFSYIGPEILLFVFPFLKQKKASLKYALLGMGTVTLTYFYLTVLTMGYYGVQTLQHIIWPSVNLLKALEIPFFGRVEFFFIFLWIGVGFTTIAAYFYLANFSLTQFFRWPNSQVGGIIISPVIIYLFLLPENIIDIFDYTELIAVIGSILVFIIPPILLLTAKLRGIKGAVGNE